MSVEDFVTFPGSTDNIIHQFAAMENGFALADHTASCSFNSYFPVGSKLALNGGRLYLNRDMHLDGDVNFSTTGSIYGDGNVLFLPRTLNGFTVGSGLSDKSRFFTDVAKRETRYRGRDDDDDDKKDRKKERDKGKKEKDDVGKGKSDGMWLRDLVIRCQADTTLASTTYIDRQVVFFGDDRQITFDNDVIMNPGSSLKFEQVVPYFRDASLRMDNACTMSLSNVFFATDFGRTSSISTYHALRDMVFSASQWRTPVRWEIEHKRYSTAFRLHNKMALTTTWLINGDVTIDGAGHIFDITHGCIAIENDSVVTFKNMILMNVTGHAISCRSPQGTIVSDDVTWVMDGRYTFTQGSMHFVDETIFEGNISGGVFVYASGEKSIVHPYSHIMFDRWMTFSYAPPHSNFSTIGLAHRTSELSFHGCHQTIVGNLTFTSGRILLQDHVHLFTYPRVYGNGVSEGGLQLGDSMGNDCVLSMKSGSVLHVHTGRLTYCNTSLDSMSILDEISGFRFDNGTELHLYEDLPLLRGALHFGAGSTFAHKKEKNIIGSTHIGGNIKYEFL